MSKTAFIQEDIDFLNELNSDSLPEGSRIYLTAKVGQYVRNLDRDKLQHLENIYKRVIDPGFKMCFHCSSDVLKVVLKVYEALEAEQPAEAPAQEPEADSIPPVDLGTAEAGEAITEEVHISEAQGDEQPEEPATKPAPKKSRSKK